MKVLVAIVEIVRPIQLVISRSPPSSSHIQSILDARSTTINYNPSITYLRCYHHPTISPTPLLTPIPPPRPPAPIPEHFLIPQRSQSSHHEKCSQRIIYQI